MHRAPKTSTRFGKLSLLLALAMVVAAFAVGPLAGAGVERYQFDTYAVDIVELNNDAGYGHFYEFTLNPCDGTWTVDSAFIKAAVPQAGSETVTGITLANGELSFTSLYSGTYNPGYTYSPTIALVPDETISLVSSNGGVTSVTGTWEKTSTDYNHGEYVAEFMDEYGDAPHSCIGMPIVSRSKTG